MKRCTWCGNTFPDSENACPVDQHALISHTPPVPEGAGAASAEIPYAEEWIPRTGVAGGIELQFATTWKGLWVLGALCISGPVLFVGLIGLLTCRSRIARSNAWFATISGGIALVVGALAYRHILNWVVRGAGTQER